MFRSYDFGIFYNTLNFFVKLVNSLFHHHQVFVFNRAVICFYQFQKSKYRRNRPAVFMRLNISDIDKRVVLSAYLGYPFFLIINICCIVNHACNVAVFVFYRLKRNIPPYGRFSFYF